jgi:hypothetical protein
MRLVWQKDGFNNDKHKKAYNDNKARFKVGQSLRVSARCADKDKALIVLGATWFGSPGKRGVQK